MNMNRKTIITSLLMLAILPASAQKLIAEKTIIDVGKTGFQQPVTAVFEFKNKSIRRLRIESVQPDCNCTVVEYPKKVIGMGEKFQIKMTYDAQQLGHFDKQAAIISNGTKKPFYIRMKGIVSESYQDFSATIPSRWGICVSTRTNWSSTMSTKEICLSTRSMSITMAPA